MKRKVKKTRVLLLVFAMIAILMVAALGILLLTQGSSKPSFLLEKELKGDFATNEYLYINNKELKAAVYYPKEYQDMIKPLARQIAEDIKDVEVSDPTYLKVDYEQKLYNDKYLGVEYTFELNGHPYHYYYFSDMDGNTFNQDVVDEFLLTQISLEARAKAKMLPEFNDVAYTKEFANNTTADKLNDFEVFVVENKMIVEFADYYDGMPLTLEIPLDEISNHLSLDLGVNQVINVENFRIPNKYVDPNRPMVALTFDDGPYQPRTSRIVDALYQNDATATFYVLGHRLANEHQMVKEMLSEGNDIGNHSWNHPNLNKLSQEELAYQFNNTNTYLNENITNGLYNIRTFRTPYGASNKFVSDNSPYPFIMWSIDTEDWKNKNPDMILDNIKSNVKDGSIILMHDIHETSVDGAIKAIEYLKAEGYQIVSVEDMFDAKGIEFVNGVNYSKG